jgi:peptide/nickel transport system substrate-binding protein
MEPLLAERWERSEDGTEYVFHLRSDVRWHDGEPFTAADVVFTFEAIYHNRVPNSLKHILTIDGQRIQVEAVDDYTVRFRLPRPFAPLINSIGMPILPEHVLGESLKAGTFAQQWGVDTPPERLIGTGPYQMVKYVPAQYIQLRRNPRYWMKDESGRPLPYLEQQTILIVPNQDTAYLKFLAQQTDIHNPRPEEVADLKGRGAELGIQVVEIGLDTGMTFVTFNRNPQHYVKNGKRDPRLDWFTDKRFLRAIAHSIDKNAMVVNCLHGLGRPAVTSISPENRLFHNPRLEDFPYDLEQAREGLTEAGYQDRDGDGTIEDEAGNPIEFTLHTNAGNQVREKMCSILKEDWTKLGLKVNYRPLDFTLLVEKLNDTYDWDAILIGFTGGLEPHNAANLLRSSGNLHLWQPNQPQPATEWEAEIDRLLDEGSRELDVEKRRHVYWRIQEILQEELPMIQTVRQTQFAAYDAALKSFHPTVWGVYRPELIHFAD